MKPWCLGRTSVGENSDREGCHVKQLEGGEMTVFVLMHPRSTWMWLFFFDFLRIVPFVNHGIKPHHLGFVFLLFRSILIKSKSMTRLCVCSDEQMSSQDEHIPY